MYQRTTICSAGWLYLILLSFVVGGAIMREINLLMFVAGIMVGPLLLSWRFTSRMTSRIEVKRIVPRGVGVGETFTAELLATNHKKRLPSWALVVGDRLSRVRPAGDRPTPVSTFVPFLLPGATDRTSYEGKLLSRGQYRFGPIVVASRFPLGLFRRIVRLEEMTTVFAYPQLGRLTRQWAQAIQQSRIGNQRSQNRLGAIEGEFHSLRDWRTGDSRRWIHWRTSARRNELIVKQFELRQNRDIALLLNLRESADVTDGSEVAVEKALRFTATIVAHECRRGSSRMWLGIAGRTLEIVSGVSSSGLMEDAMEKLAVAEGHPETRLSELIERCSLQLPSAASLILISTERVEPTEVSRVFKDTRRIGKFPRVHCIDCGSRDVDTYFEDFDTVSHVQRVGSP